MAKIILFIHVFILAGALSISAQVDEPPAKSPTDSQSPNKITGYEYDSEDEQEDAISAEKNSIIRVTSKEVEAYLKGEYNKSFTYYGDISIIGALEFNNLLRLRGGLAIGKASGGNEFYSFINTSVYPFSKIQLNFSLSYIYNHFAEYNAHIHSIFPHIAYDAKIAGFTFGVHFKFTNLFDYPAIYEHIIAFFLHFNIINTSSLQLKIGAGNLNDFQAKNTGAYSLLFYSTLHIDARMSIVNEIEIMQTGGFGLTTNLYGFAWRGGVKILL